jgi:predicted RNA-binding protein with PIN domain
VLAPRGRGTSLHRARTALLERLADIIDSETLSQTTVVFDGREAPPGLPRQFRHGTMQVLFASRDREADELIEDLIGGESAPRRLTVVSSDHRVQRAARRRQAQAIDSQDWFARQSQRQPLAPLPGDAKPSGPLSEQEVREWLNEFGESG